MFPMEENIKANNEDPAWTTDEFRIYEYKVRYRRYSSKGGFLAAGPAHIRLNPGCCALCR